MSNSGQNPEVKTFKPVTESVEDLISRKKAEKESAVSESTTAKMESTQGEVAEVMTGAEKPSEKISEKSGEKSEKKGGGSFKAGQSAGDDSQIGDFTLKHYTFPSDEVMIRKIRQAINAQIKDEWKKAQKYQTELGMGGASKYNKAIAKIRALQHILSSLFTSAADFLKEVYVKYFHPNGNRKKVEDISS